MPDRPDLLDILRMLMDMLDELVASMKSNMLVLEKYEEKIDALAQTNITDTENIQQVLASLPPERAAACMMAIEAMSKLLVMAEENEETFKVIAAQLKHVTDMRDHLHAALEGMP